MKLYIPHYLDASVVVKLVAREPGSDRIRSYLQTNRTYEFYITEFALYEVLGVLKRKWLKGEISEAEYFAAVALLDAHLRERIHVDRDFRPTDRSILVDLRELVQRRTLDYSDALQIYAILHGKMKDRPSECAAILVTADEGLAVAAAAEGLRTWHFPDGPIPNGEFA